jgi:primosomal protein N' (replication factor Y)
MLPWARVLRWDLDASRRKGERERIYRNFVDGGADILVGTQLVAHGFNFPNVTLVGVIDADSALHLPDFRAAEKTFQLVTQVAGRSGRGEVRGDVLIQTRTPDHYALSFAGQMDYKGFAETELKYRAELNYPPFTHLVEIRAEHKDKKRRAAAADEMANWLWSLTLSEPVGILGPSQARILVKVPPPVLSDFLRQISGFLAKAPARFSLDVDP